MQSSFLHRLFSILTMLLIIIVTGFILVRLMPGDKVRLRNTGFSADGMHSSSGNQQYLRAYYEGKHHLPVFYISVNSIIVPDSFYYLPDDDFRFALIRLTLQTGKAKEVYALLKKDKVNSWRSVITKEQISIDRISEFYRPSQLGSDWGKLKTYNSGIRKYIPMLSFSKQNQFHTWLFGDEKHGGILTGDFGTSTYSGRKVWDELKAPFKLTSSMAMLSLVFSSIVSVLLALWLSGTSKFVKVHIISPLFLAVYAIPIFWIGTWLLYLFANPDFFHLFPASGMYQPGSTSKGLFYLWIILPLICYSFGAIIFITRLLMEGFEEEMKADYSRTAFAKGASPYLVRKKHQLRNILIPALAVIAGSFPLLLNGSVLIEQIFSFPGLGALMIRAVQTRDVPLLSGFFLVTGFVTILIFQLVDILARQLDPRVRTSKYHPETSYPLQ